MKNTKFNIISLIANHITDLIDTKPTVKEEIILPEKVGKFSLTKKLSYQVGSDVRNGIYTNINNQLIFVKYWHGIRKNYNYYSLKNEAKILGVLSNVQLRVENNFPNKYTNIRVPRLINVTEKEDELFLEIEYVKARDITRVSKSKQISSYLSALEYLGYLFTNMSSAEITQISKRNGMSYIFTYPMYLIKALTYSPNSRKILISGLLIFLKAIPNLVKKRKLSFAHRDLHFENILCGGETIYLIDFQFSVLTYKVYDILNTLRYTWNREGILQKYFIKHILKNIITAGEQELIKPLLIFIGTLGLSSTDISSKRNKDFEEYLSYGIHWEMK